MYQRNIGRNSLCESVVSKRSFEKETLERTPSLDSLANSSSHSESSRENGNTHSVSDKRRVKLDYMEGYQDINAHRSVDDLSDVDSIEDPREGHVLQTTQVQIHAAKADFEDDEAVTQSEIPNDPVVTAYLEKASHISQNSCVKSMVQFNVRQDNVGANDQREEEIVPNSCINNGGLVAPNATNTSSKRRTSLSSGSVGRMETIVEEPIEPKVSVKEILARFETLRESAEVRSYCSVERKLIFV